MAANLSNLLSKLSASQLATITFESGVDSSGQISSASFEGYIAATTTAANPGKPASTIQLSTWQTHLGTGATVSYSFLSGGAAYAFTGLEQDYATQALQLWSGVANINFAYRLPAQGAQVVFLHSFDKLSAQPNPVPAGTAWSPGAAIDTQTTGLVQQQTGSINVDNTSTQGGALSYGSISSYTSVEGFGIDSLIHEAGHLLGLGHSGPYNSTGPSDKTDFATLQNNNTDVLQWSVMSYISPNSKTAPNYGKYNPLPSDTTEAAWGNQRAPFSPMGMDIFAAQRLYGAPTSTMFSGGKTFGFNSTVMYRKIDGTQGKLSMFDFDQTYDANGNATHLNDETPVLTLFDTGANNTFDVSGFTTASNIDLRDGEFSSVASLHDNIFIEYGTQIDHVIGGAGDDTFTVNDRSDVIDGGGGVNTVKFVSPRSAYVLSYSGASTILTNSSSGAAYRLTNIQQFQFGAAPAIALSDLPRVQ